MGRNNHYNIRYVYIFVLGQIRTTKVGVIIRTFDHGDGCYIRLRSKSFEKIQILLLNSP